MLDFLTGTRRPAPGVPPAMPDAVRGALLAVNRPTAPFVVRPCTQADRERADLVAEWRLAEPAWFAVFRPVESKLFRIYMRLVPERGEVRAIDRSLNVVWSAAGPRVSLSWSRGQQTEFRLSTSPFVETTAQGRQLRFHFSTGELKNPLRDAVTAAGWTWRGVVWSL